MAADQVNTAPADASTPSLPRRMWRRARRYAFHPQILLSMKAALAAGIAWFIAVRIPGVAAEYPYYAPLGALVSMYPTVAGTAKQGLQTMVGLAIGIALAFVAVGFGDTNSLTIAFVVGLGMLLAGLLPRIGGGAQWIPTAGLFVLVLGGPDAENYSWGYLVQMLIGVLVGLSINTFIFPPLNLNAALTRISGLRTAVAAQLAELGGAMQESWPADDVRWSRLHTDLERASQGVREAVQYADYSRKANLRRRLHPRDLARDYARVQVLEQVTLQVRAITLIFAEGVEENTEELAIPQYLEQPLQHAFLAISDLLRGWTVAESDDENLAKARTAMSALVARLHERSSAQGPVDADTAIVMNLQRILRVLTPQLTSSPPGGPDDGPHPSAGVRP